MLNTLIGDLFNSTKENEIEYKEKRLIRVDKFPIQNNEKIRIVWESTNSKWKQAIRLRIDKQFIVNSEKIKNAVFWEETSPKIVDLQCQTKDGILWVYNGWDSGIGSLDAWIGNAAMIVEELENGRRYRCNDGYPDDDFDDIIFRIERFK